MTVQVFPGSNAQTTVTVSGGRVYTCAVGAVIQVNEADALMLQAAGWCRSGQGAGTTAQRPTSLPGSSSPLPLNFEYLDTTLNITMIWNGKSWIRADTGAIA